jgi:hypothetical protein
MLCTEASIRRAGSADPAMVRDAVADSGDLQLLTGDARFNPGRHRMHPTFLLLATKDGRFDFVLSNKTLESAGD